MNDVQLRSPSDLDRAVRVLAEHFNDDAVVIVGSQAILVGWPNAPEGMRHTEEIDAYPAHYKAWENDNPGFEASEETAGLFGQDSGFHNMHGFYIDGVDENTAKLPPGWQKRAVYKEVKTATSRFLAIAPCEIDLVVSKLNRLAEKDRSYISALHDARALDIPLVKDLFRQCGHGPEKVALIDSFLDGLPKRDPRPQPGKDIEVPPYPADTHAAFISNNGYQLTIRKLDPQAGVYIKRDNPLGPAHVTSSAKGYFLEDAIMSEERWKTHPDVVAAKDAQSTAPEPTSAPMKP